LFIYFTNSDYRKQKVDIISLLDKDIQEFKTKIEEKNIKIIKNYNKKSSIVKFIDKEPLILCFRNILKNAIRYSNE
jgi:signal transduction histidine kinase